MTATDTLKVTISNQQVPKAGRCARGHRGDTEYTGDREHRGNRAYYLANGLRSVQKWIRSVKAKSFKKFFRLKAKTNTYHSLTGPSSRDASASKNPIRSTILRYL